MKASNQMKREHSASNQTQNYIVLETNKDKIQTWNHLAWRRDAKAVRHFCLSRTSAGSMTESVSIGRWNKKTRYSLTKGSSVSRPGGTQAAFPKPQAAGRGGGGTSPLENRQKVSTSRVNIDRCMVQHTVFKLQAQQDDTKSNDYDFMSRSRMVTKY